MFTKNKREKFSLRKYKDGRTDSKLIGATILAASVALAVGASPVAANVTSNGANETKLVTDVLKADSTSATTFTDDQNPAKKVTVDAVIGRGVLLPIKVNVNVGEIDGSDTVKFTSKATVNYLLEEDGSKLQDSKTVDGNIGAINTPYDRKGIAYDTDGKDYRESTVEKTSSVNESTGQEEKIQANNKEYELVRSEVINPDKATYEKTHFNNIEAPVSPEGMHNNIGEINYEKITGKVYLVEETSNGQYGKFVEATNINSDEEAVKAWKNGQVTAKDFTKENVTLQEGDTILVLDKDTYAHGSGVRTVDTINYRREKIAAKPEYNYTAPYERTEGIPGSPTYAFWNQEITGEFSTIGDDYTFGTADDKKVNFNKETVLYYNNITKSLPPGITDSSKYNFKNESLQEILEEMHAQIKGILEYFDHNVNNDEDRKEVQARKEALKQNISSTIEMIKQNHIQVVVESERGLVFSQANLEILKQLRTRIEEAHNVLDNLNISLGTSVETLPEYKQLKNVTLTKKGVLEYSRMYGFESGIIKSYHKDAIPEHYSDWEIEYPIMKGREDSVYANKGNVSISDDLSKINVINKEHKISETEFTKQDVSTKEETDYVTKELITPVRAYKVMNEGEPVVNHYYTLATKRSDEPILTENTKVGTVTVNYMSDTGEEIKEPETVVTNIPYEVTKTYAVMSGTTKVGEEKVVETLTPSYNTRPHRTDRLVDDKTGLTYEFDSINFISAPETGVVDKPQTIVNYRYRLVSKEDNTPTVTEAKGSVVVKYVDTDGNEIKDAKNVVTDAVVKTTKTYATKSGDVILSTRDKVEKQAVIYSTQAAKEQIITKDGKTYKLYGVLPVDAKFSNVTEEVGIVKEGVTTIVYQYVMQVDAPVLDVPDFSGGVNSMEPPIVEIPEYTEPVGTVPNDAPVYDIPEFNAGVNGIPEVHEKPEFTGGVNPIEPPIVEIPELDIPLIPMEEMSDPRLVEKPKPKPTPKEDVTVIPADFSKQEEPKVDSEPKPIVEAPHVNNEAVLQEEKAMLPNTGTQDSAALAWLGMIGFSAVLGISKLKKKED